MSHIGHDESREISAPPGRSVELRRESHWSVHCALNLSFNPILFARPRSSIP